MGCHYMSPKTSETKRAFRSTADITMSINQKFDEANFV
ncbi:hypothetical protein Z950_92 [Sulfitobacter mediterraneus KCTC 32188]|nr:hypothetical protein Z950_92 [Sulfitobacter mediterraneus KCTC 32188]